MQRITVLAVISGWMCLFLSGCGTMMNTAYFAPSEGRDGLYGGGKSVYGGVCVDAVMVREALRFDRSVGLGGVLFALDLPFSVVGDTLTLPYTLWWQWQGFTELPSVPIEDGKMSQAEPTSDVGPTRR